MRHRHPLRFEPLEDRAVPATLFVSNAGSNGNAGTTAAAAWQTLQYAADHVQPGDTVWVLPGSYAGFNLTTSGTAAARIAFRGQGPGVNVTSPTTWNNLDGINLEGASYVTIEGFTVNNMPRTGIRAVTDQFVVIRGNSMDQNGVWGILTGFSSDLTIEYNVCSRSAQQHGIYVGNTADRPVIRGNVCWGNHDNGIHINGDINTQWTGSDDGIISNALVENNVIYDNGTGGGSGINCDGVQNSVIRNNLIYNSHASGISLYDFDSGGPSSGNLVENNTVLVASDGRWALNVADGAVNTTIRNNILYSAHSFRGTISASADSLPGLVSDYNATEDRLSTDGGDTAITLAQWRAATGQDAHSFTVADPAALFVNAAGGDYHLKAGSAAIDKGTTAGAPPSDYEGQPRPQGAGIDIGHDEYSTVVSPPPPLPPAPPPPSPPAAPPPASPPPGQRDRKPPTDLYAVAAGPGGGPHVRVFNPDGSERFSFFAYDPGFTGGLSVATADVTGDGMDDIITGALSGGGPHVQVFDGTTLALVRSFFAYDPGFRGGVQVAAGDVTGDGLADIVTAAGSGGGPHVQAFDGATGAVVRSFFAYDAGFTGGVRVTAGDVTGDGVADIVTSAGSGGGPHVKAFDGGTLAVVRSLFAFDPSFGGGVNVAAGDVTGDGIADFVVGQASGGSQVRVIDGATQTPLRTFDPLDGFTGGARVAAADTDGDGRDEIVVGAGPGGAPRLQAWTADGVNLFDRFTYDPGFTRGVSVG